MAQTGCQDRSAYSILRPYPNGQECLHELAVLPSGIDQVHPRCPGHSWRTLVRTPES